MYSFSTLPSITYFRYLYFIVLLQNFYRTIIVHENLDKPLTQEEFESLTENDFQLLKYGHGFDNTSRKKDLDKKYSLRLRKQKEADKVAS